MSHPEPTLQQLLDEYNRFLADPAASRVTKRAAAERLKRAIDARLPQLECDCECDAAYRPARFEDGSRCPCICHDPEPDLVALEVEREQRYQDWLGLIRACNRLAGYHDPEPAPVPVVTSCRPHWDM